MKQYRYHPVCFYVTCFFLTWLCWMTAALLSHNAQGADISMTLMLLGLMMPSITALCMVLCSNSRALKQDLKEKLTGWHRMKVRSIVTAVLLFSVIVILSILISLLFGHSIDQFSFTEGFSFSISGTSALLTILLASVIEEIGWRGYGEDAIAYYCSWWKESIIFGIVWSLWHLPLFWIAGTYHAGLKDLGIIYMINFLISVIPLGFLTTWVYVKNNRSLLACIIFHLFVNTMQEKIAMTPQTKCIETLVITIAAAVIVWRNKNMFFETKHVGKLLDDNAS